MLAWTTAVHTCCFVKYADGDRSYLLLSVETVSDYRRKYHHITTNERCTCSLSLSSRQSTIFRVRFNAVAPNVSVKYPKQYGTVLPVDSVPSNSTTRKPLVELYHSQYFVQNITTMYFTQVELHPWQTGGDGARGLNASRLRIPMRLSSFNSIRIRQKKNSYRLV